MTITEHDQHIAAYISAIRQELLALQHAADDHARVVDGKPVMLSVLLTENTVNVGFGPLRNYEAYNGPIVGFRAADIAKKISDYVKGNHV